jgi:hypothetical protein
MLFFIGLAAICFAEIIPCDQFPNPLRYGGKTIGNPSSAQCVKAGYRLKAVMPVTPAGKQVKSVTWEQDAKDASKCVAVCAYEDVPPPPPPEVLIEIPATNIVFWATSNGVPREWRLKSIAATNKVEK